MIGNTLDPNLISALNGKPPAEAGATQMPKSSGDELRESFLDLLITQLKHQDPLDPLKNNELTSQLAQINTVTGVDALNDTMSGIVDQIDAGRSLQAAELIGKGVMAPGQRLIVGDEGTTTPFGIELSQPAAELQAHIVNSAGQRIRSLDLGSVDAGASTFRWDGLLDSGEQAPAGAYRIEFQPANAQGDAMEHQSLNYALVQGVSRTDEGPLLDLGGIADPITLDDVRKIL